MMDHSEGRHLHPDGSISWFYVQVAPEQDEDGSVVGYIGTLTDITERKQAEMALQASEARFRQVFASNIVGMMFTDLSGQVFDANDRFLEMIGYTRKELNAGGINWVNLTPTEYLLNDRQAMEQLEQDRAIDPWEKEYCRKDGSRVPVLVGGSSTLRSWQS